MKKKKLMFVLGLAVSLSLLMCACGNSDTKSQSESTVSDVSEEKETGESTGSPDATSVEVSTETTTEASTEASTETSTETSTEASTETKTETSTEQNTQEATEVSKEYINLADVSWIDPEKPMVALSFDDGPVYPVDDFSTAIRIQNALSENGMHATFFYWGNTLNSSTMAELKRAYELGFELGNHTKSHPNLTDLTAAEITAQIEYIDKKLTAITGNTQFLVRPPYLAVNDLVKETINVPLISCGLDTQDWNDATTEEIIATVKKACENGSLDGKIVLMHETYTTTAEAVEYLVPYLKEQGYQVVTISELFKARGKNPLAGKVYTQCVK